jgi:hypothetical protein
MSAGETCSFLMVLRNVDNHRRGFTMVIVKLVAVFSVRNEAAFTAARLAVDT